MGDHVGIPAAVRFALLSWPHHFARRLCVNDIHQKEYSIRTISTVYLAAEPAALPRLHLPRTLVHLFLPLFAPCLVTRAHLSIMQQSMSLPTCGVGG